MGLTPSGLSGVFQPELQPVHVWEKFHLERLPCARRPPIPEADAEATEGLGSYGCISASPLTAAKANTGHSPYGEAGPIPERQLWSAQRQQADVRPGKYELAARMSEPPAQDFAPRPKLLLAPDAHSLPLMRRKDRPTVIHYTSLDT